MLLWGDKSCGHHLFVTSLDKDRCSSSQSLLEIFGAVMFYVNAVKEKNRFVCLGGPVQPGLCCGACLALSLVAGVGALQNYLHVRGCRVIVASGPPGSLYFSRQLVELENQLI